MSKNVGSSSQGVSFYIDLNHHRQKTVSIRMSEKHLKRRQFITLTHDDIFEEI